MIDSRVIRFFRKHHVLTIATTVDNEPWCANCFYVYLEEENCPCFHLRLRYPSRAGVSEEQPGRRISCPGDNDYRKDTWDTVPGDHLGTGRMIFFQKPKTAYLKRFPVAALMDTRLWIVRLTYIKMTDNRLGFGKKLIWTADPPSGNDNF